VPIAEWRLMIEALGFQGLEIPMVGKIPCPRQGSRIRRRRVAATSGGGLWRIRHSPQREWLFYEVGEFRLLAELNRRGAVAMVKNSLPPAGEPYSAKTRSGNSAGGAYPTRRQGKPLRRECGTHSREAVLGAKGLGPEKSVARYCALRFLTASALTRPPTAERERRELRGWRGCCLFSNNHDSHGGKG
jgi:hypothetical protein